MDFLKYLSIFLLVILLTPGAGGTREDDLSYISQPGNIPLFTDFATPQLEPGDTGRLNFSLTNRYDKEITQVNVTMEIYLYANIPESKNLSRVKKPPYFVNSHTQLTYKIWNRIDPDEKKTDAGLYIGSWEDTEQGTYFIRFTLSFDYNGYGYIMKSRGHFTNEEWKDATTNTTEEDPGNINITKLGVDGIIPDTTFGVKKNDEDGDGFIIGFDMVVVICAIGLSIIVSLRKGNR